MQGSFFIAVKNRRVDACAPVTKGTTNSITVIMMVPIILRDVAVDMLSTRAKSA